MALFLNEEKEKHKTIQSIENALKKGWRYKEFKIDPEGLMNAVENLESVKHALSYYVRTLANEYQTYSRVPFPLNLWLAFDSEEVKECQYHLSSLFSSEAYNYNDWDQADSNTTTISATFSLSQEVLWGSSEDENEGAQERSEVKKWMIGEIINNLGEPDEIEAEIHNYPTRLKFPTHRYKEIYDELMQKQSGLKFGEGCALHINWVPHETWLYAGISSSGFISTIFLMTKRPKDTIEERLKGKVVMDLSNNSRIGRFRNCYPLESFHEETKGIRKSIEEVVAEAEQQPRKFVSLIKGEPGTGKTEWVKSFIHNVLGPQGYVTFFLDANTIKNFSPPDFLPKVAVFVNEVDNLLLDRERVATNGLGEVGDIEALLGFFDGSIYQSIQDDQQGELDQSVFIFLTANTTERLDRAFKREGRVDLIYEFKHQYVDSTD